MSNLMNKMHIEHWEKFFDDGVRSKLYPTWWDNKTANHWRHERFLQAPLLVFSDNYFKKLSWLLIGDGSGHDTWILRSHGFEDILTTDIGVKTLAKSLSDGHITRYEQANAERLQYIDNSFDFVLCKEALHHMERPYSAIYEMLRVTRKAVIIIEPQDRYIDLPCYEGPVSPSYESVGNFVYGFSRAEMAKVAYGLNLEGVATKNIVDVYMEGCEFHRADDLDPLFIEMKNQVEKAEALAKEGKVKWNYLLTIFFKKTDNEDRMSKIQESLRELDWSYLPTNTNPYLG